MVRTQEEMGATKLEESNEEETMGEKQHSKEWVHDRILYNDDEVLFDVDDDIMDIIGDNDKKSEPFEALLDVVTLEITQRDGETRFERAEAYGDFNSLDNILNIMKWSDKDMNFLQDQIQENSINKQRIGVLTTENEELKKVIKCMETNETTKKKGEECADNVVMKTQVLDFVIKLMDKDIQIFELENLVKVMKKETDDVKAEMAQLE
ncbi:unnamed protein product, partial [Ilex paraguariensis]